MASDNVLLWPPRSCASTGRVALDGPVHIEGPWTDVGRFALRVLDPLPGPPDPAAPHLHIRIQDDPGLPHEGYRLATSRAGTTIAASSPDGVRQAAITLLQLLPDAAWREGALRRDDWLLPEVTIQDAPAFEYRGLMLDVARHFATVTEVLRWIELAALHRLNRLHLHLTDDQGWRVESAAYPRLAEIASWRSATWIGHGRYGEEPDPANVDGTPHGGFYSREDLREIGDHAARHGITLVPEVDLPGHACALLAAIPELGVPGCPPQAVSPFWWVADRSPGTTRSSPAACRSRP